VHRDEVCLRLFGPIRLQVAGRTVGGRAFGGVKPRQILAAVALERGHVVTKDQIAEVLWGEAPPREYTAVVESYVSVLRHVLEPGVRRSQSVLLTERGGYRLSPGVWLDIAAFDALVAGAAAATGAVAAARLEEALALVGGPLLEDEPYADWAVEARNVYHRRHVQALIRLAELRLGEGDFDRARTTAEQALQVDPLAEAACRLAMAASYLGGDAPSSLSTYERFRERLTLDVGVEPMPETRSLHEAIAEHRALPVAFAPRSSGDAAPRHGLWGRGELVSTEAVGREPPFLGRQEEIGVLRDWGAGAGGRRFTVVVVEGEPGIGKSRFLKEVRRHLPAVRVGVGRFSSADRGIPGLGLVRALANASLEVNAPLSPEGIDALVVRVANAAPIALLLDDLCDADDMSVATLQYLGVRLTDAPVLVVATCRHPAPPWLTDELSHETTRLVLGPLAPSEVEALGRADLADQTRGHPLLVAAALDCRLFPAVQEWARARHRELPPDLRALVELIAVVSPPARVCALAEVTGRDAMEVARSLDALWHRGVLEPRGDGFIFRYPGERRALRAEMSPARRALVRRRMRHAS
jgi:DNA-binding SARP family transcriptional activator